MTIMIKHIPISIALIFLLFPCFSLGGVTVGLPGIVFNAFIKDDPGLFSKNVMTEAHYRILTNGGDDELTENEYEQKLKDAGQRARKNTEKSFKAIRDFLVEKGFDFSKADLIRVEPTTRKGVKTERVKYRSEMKDQRLDIHLIITSGDKTIDLKIDDCFLVEQNATLTTDLN